MFGHLAFLANARNAYGYVCYVVFATEVNDVVAFTFGRMFGRHPLRSQISPRKTWEGALGALAVSMTLPWLLRIDSLIYVAPLFMHMTGYYYPLR
jgi:phosphatidate cytidylyltransferase